jgi:hypothetical protein
MNSPEPTSRPGIGSQIYVFLWLSAAFITIFSAKLWLIDLYGSAMPWWDQWPMEGWSLYAAFLNKTLTLKDLFAAHCEHRAFINRLSALLLFEINGQWDPRLGMVLNAGLTAFTGTTLSMMGWILLGRKQLAVLILFNTLVFSLPFSWECSLLGFVGNYWLIFFALLAIWFLTRYQFPTPLWLLGLIFALLSLVTMGSGFFAAAAVFVIVILRLVFQKSRRVPAIVTMLILFSLIIAGYYLRVNVSGHEIFKAPNARELFVSICQNLAWPNPKLPWTFIIVWLPSLLLLAAYIIQGNETRRKAEFVLAFGLWVAMQAAALAYFRCGIIASRHMVFLCLSLPVNFLAILVLFKSLLPLPARNILVVVFVIWISNSGYQLWKISDKSNLNNAVKQKAHLTQCEKNLRAFIETDDIANLQNKRLYDIPFPDAQSLALALRNPQLRAILPACVNPANKPGPLSLAAAKLIPKGDKLIFVGIGLLIILCAIRFYQSLGVFEKRVENLRWSDYKQILMMIGFALILLFFLLVIHGLYSMLSLDGLKVTYFRGKNFEEKICTRTEKAVFRDYEDKSPAWRVPAKNFSALWEGILRVPETADYSFFSQSDDGLRLIIDGQKIIDNWRDQNWGASACGAQVHLTAGEHKIAVEHYNNEGESALRIKWSGGPVPPNTVLAAPYLRKHK